MIQIVFVIRDRTKKQYGKKKGNKPHNEKTKSKARLS